ncbi:oxygen-independent coproporphyrinogen III oxidase [Dysgonomonas sp. OttesenSCG-928-M03]|nr:oxygen-independent coproporphyrinogen III oxidase [Dysgonomonas sp. OttesenSCG-928-M03]
MTQELLNKYNVAVPRYTSYPPANFFTENFTRQAYRNAIADSNVMQPEHISFYVHIPFCYKMCHYCGCNALLLENKDTVSAYMKALRQEIQMILPLLKKNRKVSQIHYGGGSPTSQPVSVLKEINEMLLSEFETIDNPEIAIECHPGYLDEKYWYDLTEAGFNRVSIGIQDFDDNILKIVNRKPSRIPIEEIVKLLKEKGLSVNMDFIYGLPLQTPESFTNTIQKAIDMKPDRLVTFSYAHVPWVNPAQLNLEKAGLPDPQEKNRIYERAKQTLTDAGYKTIGLDHFVLPNDELYLAKQNKALHRNFQGYCTRRTTGQVYAFGVTGISQLATAYSQNVKDLKSYIEILGNKRLPVFKGYILNEEERITREVINTLMCNYEIQWKDIATYLNVSIDQIMNALNYNKTILDEFAKDGLIEFDSDHIMILPEATPFVRNVAASLDKLMLNTDKRFSKVG